MVSWGPSPSPDICAGGKQDPPQGNPLSKPGRVRWQKLDFQA